MQGAYVESAQNRPALVPVRVPWQISASAAFIRPEASEINSEKPFHVDFVGFFALHEAGDPGRSGAELLVVESPPPFVENQNGVSARFHHVRVQFDRASAFRMFPALSDSRVIDDAAYNWTQVAGRWLPGEKVEDSLRRIRAVWRETSICPNPRMYEVRPSQWKDQVDLSAGVEWSHYLLAGSDEYIEIIAASWTWILGQPVS